jgi:hypothetical protein
MMNLKMSIVKQAMLLWAVLVIVSSCKNSQTDSALTVKIKNPLAQEVKEQVVVLYDSLFLHKLSALNLEKLHVTSGDVSIAFQLIDKNSDGNPDKVILLLDFNAEEEKELLFAEGESSPAVVKKTQAEISVKEGGEWVEVTKKSGVKQFEYQGGDFKNVTELNVPDQHTDHSFYIRYEGPGWESDKVGYRFYLDWRNAVDIFGKKTTDMVLQQVGQDGFDSYHELSDWGMDVLKVGNSLGLGSIGFWDGTNAVRVAVTDSLYCKIIENGNLYSSFKTKYYGWKDAGTSVDLISKISIFAGSRISWQKIKMSEIMDNLCTGIVKHDNGELITPENTVGKWSYIATFGEQSLNNDNLGMFIFYLKDDLIEITEDQFSHVLVLNPSDKNLKYGFGAVWEEDPGKIKSKEQFTEYLNLTLEKLNNPIEINY